MFRSERVQQAGYFGDRPVVELRDFFRKRAVKLRQRIAVTQHAQHPVQIAIDRLRSRVGRELGAGLIGASGAASVPSSDLTTLVWNASVTARASRWLSEAISSFIDLTKSRVIVGNRLRLIHSQTGDSEPRCIRPELACSGAPSTSRGPAARRNTAMGCRGDFGWRRPCGTRRAISPRSLRCRLFRRRRFPAVRVRSKGCARQRRQPLQIIPNRIGLWHGTQFPQFDPVSTVGPARCRRWSRAHARYGTMKAFAAD